MLSCMLVVLIVGLISVIDLDCLASTTFGTSVQQRRKTNSKWLFKCSICDQATHNVLATYHVASLPTAFFFHQWLYLAFQQHILDISNRNMLCI